MPTDVSPKRVQNAIERGFDRLKNFRRARLLFLRRYCGQYYDQEKGSIGTEALNLIFNAIRILVPNIVTNFPSHSVTSRFLMSREYAELLGMALSDHDKAIKIRNTYRCAIVDACFTLGIIKTGLAESDSVYVFGDEDSSIDAGDVYSELVDFDNFVVDPGAQEHLFKDAQWMGDRIRVPRAKLLESGLYRNDLIENLPAASDRTRQEGKASEMSMRQIKPAENYEMQDEVEIVEVWMPGANVTVTVPGQKGTTFDEYLRVDEFYGPDTGPYTLLALTPPVSGNPLPVPMVGIWYDLHVLANQMAKKITEQADRQKDILLYRRNAADDAQEIVDAKDGEAVATDDPDSAKIYSLGGQQRSNEIYLAQVQQWFNMMAANPQSVGGERFDESTKTATAARILQSNASVGLEDMKDLVYQMSAGEARNRAWYFHTDPFINVPLIRRIEIPAQFVNSSMGPQMISPAQMQEVQIFLTPEARRGDWLDFTFTVTPESMGRKDRQTRFQEGMAFAVKIMPAAMQSAQVAALLGIPFSVKAFILRMAKDAGIEWMDEVFFDPDYQMMMARRMMMGPSPEGSQGQPGASPNAGAGMGAILQNGQPGQVMGVSGPMKLERQDQQMGANPDQQMLKLGGM